MFRLTYIETFSLLFSFIIALLYSINFKSCLPICESWTSFESKVFPLAACNIAIHEAGHLIMNITNNEFLIVLGGTLFQIGFPIAFLIYFIQKQSKSGAIFSIFWLGYSLMDASFYMADAQGQNLILITGGTGKETGGHDWNYIFNQLNLLKQSIKIANTFFFIGIFLSLFSLVYTTILIFEKILSKILTKRSEI